MVLCMSLALQLFWLVFSKYLASQSSAVNQLQRTANVTSVITIDGAAVVNMTAALKSQLQ